MGSVGEPKHARDTLTCLMKAATARALPAKTPAAPTATALQVTMTAATDSSTNHGTIDGDAQNADGGHWGTTTTKATTPTTKIPDKWTSLNKEAAEQWRFNC